MTKAKKHINLLSYDTNAKTIKGRKKGFATGILYLAPAKESRIINVCPHASAGCKAACLYSAGRGKMPSVIQARIQKTLFFAKDRNFFIECLKKDILKLERKAIRENLTLTIRLNGTSDIPWEKVKDKNGNNLMQIFNHIQFYDYSKSPIRMIDYAKGKMPKNYHLTFSKSEENDDKVKKVLQSGGNVAIVFEKFIPDSYLGYKVVNGDDTDLRFLDGSGVVVGLKAKGDARTDESGFVVKQ